MSSFKSHRLDEVRLYVCQMSKTLSNVKNFVKNTYWGEVRPLKRDVDREGHRDHFSDRQIIIMVCP